MGRSIAGAAAVRAARIILDEVRRLEGGRWLELGTLADEAKVRAEPFDAIELELGALWADLATPKP